MKKLIVISCIIYTSLGFAQFGIFNKNPLINMENFQKQRVHWGYFLGFNTYDFKFDYLQDIGEVKVTSSFGFNVGLVGNLRINDYFDLNIDLVNKPGRMVVDRSISRRWAIFSSPLKIAPISAVLPRLSCTQASAPALSRPARCMWAT